MTIDLKNFVKYAQIISIANRGDCSGNGSFLYFDPTNSRLVSLTEKAKIQIRTPFTGEGKDFVAYLPEISNASKIYSEIDISPDYSIINDGNKIKLTTYANSKRVYEGFSIEAKEGNKLILNKKAISFIRKAQAHTKDSDNNLVYQFIYCQNGTLFASSLGRIYSVNYSKAIEEDIPDFIIHSSVAQVVNAISLATDKDVEITITENSVVIQDSAGSIIVEFMGSNSVTYPPLLSETTQSRIERIENVSFLTIDLKDSIKFLMFYASDIKNNKTKLTVENGKAEFNIESKDVTKKIALKDSTLEVLSFSFNLSFLKEAIEHIEGEAVSIYTIDDNELEKEFKKPYRLSINPEIDEEIILSKILVI
jgi:hypothetical protein